MKNINGFVLNEIIHQLNHDLKVCIKGSVAFSINKFRFKTSAKKVRKTGLILGLLLIYSNLPGSNNKDIVLETEKWLKNELTTNDRDNTSTYTTNVYRVPFILRNNLIWLEAIVDGTKGFLLLDTGMDKLVLNQSLFRGTITSGYITGVTDDLTDLQRKFVSVQISDLPAHTLNAFITDLNHLEQHLHLKILGICGIDFLQQFQWVIHYHKRFIDFHLLDKFGNLLDTPPLPEPSEIIQLKNAASHLYAKVQIEEYTMNIALDTGTSSTVFDKKYKARLLSQRKNLEQMQQVSRVVGINGTRKLITAYALSNLQMGNTTIPPMQVTFIPLNRINKGRSVKLDGIFNPLYLCYGTIGINWEKKQLYVWKDYPKIREALVVRLDK